MPSAERRARRQRSSFFFSSLLLFHHNMNAVDLSNGSSQNTQSRTQAVYEFSEATG